MMHDRYCPTSWRWLGALLLVCALRQPAAGQLDADLKLPDLMSLRASAQTGSRTLSEPASISMDSPVDAEAYFVGPGDQLALNIWSSAPVEHRLTVSPEGFLLIPAVGAVDLKGTTLAQARTVVEKRVRGKYLNSTVSLSLVAPRKVTVYIAGAVMREGMHEMHAVQRVDRLIEEANTLPSTQLSSKKFFDTDQQSLRQNLSMRYIAVQRRTGVVDRVDLVRYAITGRPEWNPYLREGDRVFVPNRRPWDNRIGVYGGVVRDVAVEFVEGDSLSHLVRLAMGLRTESGAERSMLMRLSADGGRMDSTLVDARAIMEGRASDIALRPGDRLVIPIDRDDREGTAVRIEGEVVRPGTYPITRSETHLSQIIALAGGFTANANLRAATVLRIRLKTMEGPEELEQERLLSVRTSLPVQDSAYYLTETALRLKGELVAVDFHALFAKGDSTEDITLRNYDRVIIPEFSRSVYVFGQVITPGHVPFKPNQGADYYISRAGGFTGDARTGDVRVIKGNTRAWLDPSETPIEDGDFLWVPKETPTPIGTVLTTVAQLATVLAALATVILVAKTL
jgi:protein involved in polysaccharide export with SLBB domain